ncbi:MFS transporter [Calothrix sp. 336/3]|uniref:MFS transporter n=1 Tax=Calothrix sp. 336/3 TaxID=1337936 RepID=UPI0004E3DD5E|nr:MFS transporter [Calothrix sp. 336/3]AKG20131.1 MFS transporter [Calothrix sp. 336/3]
MQRLNYSSRILWQQVGSLAGLLAAIMFSWMVYGYYQSQILMKLEFPFLANWLGIIQGLIAAIIEPGVGAIADKIQGKYGSKLPIISVGVVLAGLIFVASSLLLEQHLSGMVRWIVPVMMTVWVIAMIIFRGPAIALLRQFAPVEELPQANALLVMIFGLVGATSPLLDLFLKNIGASIAFILAAIALVISTYILRNFTNPRSFIPENVTEHTPPIPFLLLILLFIVGMSASLEVNLLTSLVPQILQQQLPNYSPQIICSVILLIAAILSVPLGDFASKFGSDKTILLGLISISTLMGISLINSWNFVTFLLIFAFALAFCLVFISMIPFTLTKVPASKAGLGTGFYFGGAGGATALLTLLMKQEFFNSLLGFVCSAIACIVATICIAKIHRIQAI